MSQGTRRQRTHTSSPGSATAVLGIERAQGASAPVRDAQTETPDFEGVYRKYFLSVTRWARAMGGLDADVDDLAQEVFVVVSRKLDTFSGPSFPAWLYGITRKTVSDYRRRAFMRRLLGGLVRSLQGSRAAQRVAGANPQAAWEARRLLSDLLERMSASHRTAFILFEIEGYSGQEISELEQIPVATVYTRLHHARRDFLRLLADVTGEVPEEPPA